MLRFDVVDVFTDRPFAGNQLAVVHGAEALTDAQLLAITREFNFSEATFPTAVSETGYAVRIFTPGGEIPFAGHPTLGTAWVLRSSFSSSQVTQRCAAGDIAVSLGEPMVSLTVLPGDLVRAPSEVTAAVVADLGLRPDDVTGPAYFAGTGLTFFYLPVVPEAVRRARPASRHPSYDGLRDPVGGIQVYAVGFEARGASRDVHARVFVPELAIPEDPATGSAAAGLGLVLVASGVLPDGGDYRISQGAELGRPSTLHGSVRVDRGVAAAVTVSGEVQPIAGGEIRIP